MQTVIQVESLLTILSVILGITAIVVSIFAVWMSQYFHNQTTQLHISLNKIVSEIGMSTKLTETTTKNLIDPIVRTILEMVQNRARDSIEGLRPSIMQRSAAILDEALKETAEEERGKAREAIYKEIDSFLGTLSHRLVMVSSSPEQGDQTPVATPAPSKLVPIPGSPLFDWVPFVRRMRDLEARNRFLSVKMLREKAFALELETQEALQIAIDRKMLLTYYVDNPKNPQFPTLACKLNPEHPTVREILQAIGELPAKRP